MKREWIIVGFKHPEESQSLIYKRGIRRLETLYAAIEAGINQGCNLFSIRGIEIKESKGSANMTESERRGYQLEFDSKG